jgi:hypothetical protein
MGTKKFVIGTLVGGITYFILGYLIYGMALSGFFSRNSLGPPGSMKTMNDIIWWALILGNLAGAALLTYIFLKLTNINSFGSGARVGAAIGFLMGLSTDLIQFATANNLDRKATLVDVIVVTVMTAIVGGVIGVVLGMGTKKP